VRAQDNYVAQWGDPDEKREFGAAKKSLAPEFTRALAPDLAFAALPDRDTYAETGFSSGFPAARDPGSARAWLVHCYAMVGRGARQRGRLGQRRRALRRDRQRAAAARPQRDARRARGARHRAPLDAAARHRGPRFLREGRAANTDPRRAHGLRPSRRRARAAGGAAHRQRDVPAAVEGRRFRRDDWYKESAGHVDVCNVPLPIRNATP
jgi:peptidylprolyl isomerase